MLAMRGTVSAGKQNGKTVQWHTSKSTRSDHSSKLYSKADCCYFESVMIPHDEVWWIPISEVSGKQSVCAILSEICWLNTEEQSTV